jgi:hypothetical protein
MQVGEYKLRPSFPVATPRRGRKDFTIGSDEPVSLVLTRLRTQVDAPYEAIALGLVLREGLLIHG